MDTGIAEIGIKICDADYQGKGHGTRILRLFRRVGVDENAVYYELVKA